LDFFAPEVTAVSAGHVGHGFEVAVFTDDKVDGSQFNGCASDIFYSAGMSTFWFMRHFSKFL
jgi:hypothetical protein